MFSHSNQRLTKKSQLPESRGDRAPFESHLIYNVVERTLFGPGKLGLKHEDRFSPIPLQFLAFLCSIVRQIVSLIITPRLTLSWDVQCNHVISCYRRGSFDREEHLQSSVQEQAFRNYLALLVEMQGEREDAIRQICTMMYDNAR